MNSVTDKKVEYENLQEELRLLQKKMYDSKRANYLEQGMTLLEASRAAYSDVLNSEERERLCEEIAKSGEAWLESWRGSYE